MKAHYKLYAYFSLLLFTLNAFADETPSPPLEVTDSVTLAGKLTGKLISTLGDGALVIDLRTEEEGASSEEQPLALKGISYINIPLGRTAPERTTVQRFTKLIEQDPQRQVIVHCSSGNRAGLLWAAHLIDQGESAEAALDTVSAIATRDPIHQAIKDYAEKAND